MQWEQVLEDFCPTDEVRKNCKERFEIWVCSVWKRRDWRGDIIKDFENKWIVI